MAEKAPVDFTETIREGMKLIMKGCRNNPVWTDCHRCPFTTLCDSIYKDKTHSFSTPDTWEEEGIWLEMKGE